MKRDNIENTDWLKYTEEKYAGYIDKDGTIDFKRYDAEHPTKSPKISGKGLLLIGVAALVIVSVLIGCMSPSVTSTRYKTEEQKEVHKAYINSEVSDYTSEADFAEAYGIIKGWN